MSNQLKTYQIPEGFSLSGLVDLLCAKYTAEGYGVTVTPIGNAVGITLAKNIGGLWVITGMGEQLSVTISIDSEKNTLSLMYSNQYWTDKIVAFILGWFCLQILWIFDAVGVYRQLRLPDDIDASVYQYIIGMK